jgi:hypothetical protein
MNKSWLVFFKGMVFILAGLIGVSTLAFLVLARPAGTALQFVLATAGALEIVLGFLWLLLRRRLQYAAGRTTPG